MHAISLFFAELWREGFGHVDYCHCDRNAAFSYRHRTRWVQFHVLAGLTGFALNFMYYAKSSYI